MEGGEKPSGTLPSVKFSWKIPNFSQSLGFRICSDIFTAGDCKWCLLVCLKNNNIKDNLSIYLSVADSISLPQGWGIEAMFSLAVVNQFDRSKSVTSVTRHEFNSNSPTQGFPHLIPLRRINDPAERYLVNDTLTCEVHVLVMSTLHCSNVNNKEDPAVEAPPSQTPLTVRNKTVKTEPLTALTAEQEGDMPVTDRMEIHSKGDPIEHVQSVSKRLLTELSSRRKKQKSIFSNEFFDSKPESTTNIRQQQKEALRKFLNMSLEAVQQANCFVKIEAILNELVQHATNLQEKASLEDIMSRLANFTRSIEDAKAIAVTAQARRSSLVKKSAELDLKLEQRQNELSSLESKFSALSEEEAKLKAEIDQVIAQKKSVSVKRDRTNEETCKEMEEWRILEEEMRQVNEEWFGANEKLASANVRWDRFREDLGF